MIKLFLFILMASILFINAHCDKDIVDPPPPLPSDTIITVEKELTDGEQPAVSPDGSKIAFVRNGDIWVMDTSGANQKQLTNSNDIDIIPRWKPDGQSIGFIRTTIGEYNKGRIFTVPPIGGIAIQIIANYFVADSLSYSSSNITYPIWEWSPDAEYVAFLEARGYKTFLKVLRVSNNEMIFDTTTYDYPTAKTGNLSCFTWSINKDEIIYIGKNESGIQNVAIKNFYLNELIIDSSYYEPQFLCRHLQLNRIAFVYIGRNKILTKDYSLNIIKEYTVFGGGGMKWSPDGSCLLFESQGSVADPFGYRFSRLSILLLSTGKQYLLTTKGDINQYNYRFDWGKSKNTIFFERFEKLNRVTFQFKN